MKHYFDEPQPYWDQDVLVVGGGNSAVETALEVYRAGGRVTFVHFADELDEGVKPWIRPDIENRFANGEIPVRWRTRVREITPSAVVLRDLDTGETEEVANDWVLAMTGWRPDPALLRSIGVSVDQQTREPAFDPDTMETDVTGVFIAGVVAGGRRPDKVFIEDGRHHGPLAVKTILAERGQEPEREISLGVPQSVRPFDAEADGIGWDERPAPEPAGESLG